MKTTQPEVPKPWAVFVMPGIETRQCIARFSARGDGEAYLYKVKRQLPKDYDPILVFDKAVL